MSKKTEAEIREHVCARTTCWRSRFFTEAGVTANLRGGWKILLLDSHFSKCVKQRNRRGGLCDGIAVNPTNNKLKLLELKQDVSKLPSAKPQLIKGGKLIKERLPAGFDGLVVEAELHVRTAPRSTIKLQKVIKIDNRKVPLRAFKEGRRV